MLALIAAGYISHLLIDSINPQGVPWLWPVKTHFQVLLVQTGGLCEHTVVTQAMLIICGWLAWPITGFSKPFPARHLSGFFFFIGGDNVDWKKLNPVEKAKAISEYLVDHTKAEAEQYFNISRGYINELLRILKLSKDKNVGSYNVSDWKKLSQIEKAKTVSEYLIDHTWAETAQYFNISRRSVNRLLHIFKVSVDNQKNTKSNSISPVEKIKTVSKYPINPLKDEASLYNILKSLKNDVDQMEAKKQRLKLEISSLERDIHRKSEAVTVTNYLRKTLSPIEKREDEIIAMLNRTSFFGAQRIEIRHWISLLGRLQKYLEESLSIVQVQGDYIDIGPQ